MKEKGKEKDLDLEIVENFEKQDEDPLLKKTNSRRRLFILIALLLIIIGFLIKYRADIESIIKQKDAEQNSEGNAGLVVNDENAKEGSSGKVEMHTDKFIDLDDIIVNLDTDGKNMSFLRIKLTIEVQDAKSAAIVRDMTPRVTDAVVTYLRGLRPSDLQGSVAIYRLREEFLMRLNKILYPAEIINVLFRDILVQ